MSNEPWYMTEQIEKMTLPQVAAAITMLRQDLLEAETYAIYRDAQAKKWHDDGMVGRRITDLKTNRDQMTGQRDG
jgi:hypothetical protein